MGPGERGADPTLAEPGWGPQLQGYPVLGLFAEDFFRGGSGCGVLNDGVDFQLN